FGEKGGQMSERSEFLFARQTSAGRREPAQRARRLGCPFAAYSFWASKKSKASSGAQPPDLAWFQLINRFLVHRSKSAMQEICKYIDD
ncbi:MAG: hypothetical protein U1D97_00045, partial [Desulfuromonadales bacterium]|nr:hypothetical protein [Desulfuromonadales bacterium]